MHWKASHSARRSARWLAAQVLVWSFAFSTASGQAPAVMTGVLGVSMSRDGSGTAWLPEASPSYAIHRTTGAWSLMFHGNAFLEYIREAGDRGDAQFGAINWAMGMARRPLAGGDLAFRAMLSAEPLTVGSCGYPDLLATGESCRGQPLYDRQHPHDLFMEVGLVFERPINQNLAVQLYGGPAGEPAIGPVAYPHRISAMPNLVAPIGHHWLDATHITYGVVTAGLFGRRWKLEGSAFNGREPDEDRYDFDLNALDSYSARLWVMPDVAWVFQASAARLVDVEPGRNGLPPVSQTRLTASANHHRAVGLGGMWATTAIWGRNVEDGQATDALLLESGISIGASDLFLRAETVQKPGEDLVPAEPALAETIFRTTSLALGYVHRVGPIGAFAPGVGARVGLSFVPSGLERLYGSRTVPGIAVFINLRAKSMDMGTSMPGMVHE